MWSDLVKFINKLHSCDGSVGLCQFLQQGMFRAGDEGYTIFFFSNVVHVTWSVPLRGGVQKSGRWLVLFRNGIRKSGRLPVSFLPRDMSASHRLLHLVRAFTSLNHSYSADAWCKRSSDRDTCAPSAILYCIVGPDGVSPCPNPIYNPVALRVQSCLL